MAYSRLVIGDRFGKVITELEAEIQSANWRLNKIGKLKFNIARTDPKATLTNLQYGNRVYVDFENGLEDWGGVIDPPRTWDNNILTIEAYSGEYLFRDRTTQKSKYFTNYAAGEIFETLINDANDLASTGVTIGEIYKGGEVHSPEYHYKGLLKIFQESLIGRLTENDFAILPVLSSGTISFQAHYYQARGIDRTGILLVEDKNLSNVKLVEQGPIINSWYAAGEGTEWSTGDRLTANAFDGDSQGLYGLREGANVYGDVSELATLQTHVDTALAKSKNPTNIFSLTAVDQDPAGFGTYSLGDTVSLVATSCGFGGTDTTVRILSREFNPGAGTCVLVVEEQFN